MGHLLSSVNPEAAAAIDGDYPRVEVGSPVKYTMRDGQRRAGRTQVPGFIMAQNDDGTCDLLLLMEPEDFIEERHIPMKSEHQIVNCWEYLVPAPVRAEIENLYAIIDELKSDVFGEYNEPPKAVMQYLADFDVRLQKIESATAKHAGKRK